MAKSCPSCGAPIDATAATCPYCGSAIPQEEIRTVERPAASTIIQQQAKTKRVKKHDRNRTTAIIITLLRYLQ